MQAIEKHFQGATWQRCQTHFIRNILDAAPKYMQDALLEEIRGILHAPNKQTARLLLEPRVRQFEAHFRQMKMPEMPLYQGFSGG
ncbi:transposase [Geobacillus thermodenitrificans]|uniref:transposase n=1 Tax=Geobacillus thermodenitrificans TaxID=33940 RepID=UPI00399CB527